MSYTLAEAAQATGIAKTTVLRAIKSGKISGTRDEHGAWRVEAAELHRIYAPVTQRGEPEQTQSYAAARMEAELAALKTMLAEARADRDRWHDAATAALRALPPPVVRRSWWRWRVA